MIVFIAATYPVAKTLTKRMFEGHNLSFCAIEAEYGVGSLTKDDIGVIGSYNHHKVGDDYSQPCLAYQDKDKEYQNFIISHIDNDTIFGIGWLSGMFNFTSPSVYNKLVELSKMISISDNFGYHSINESLLAMYQKEWDVICSYVAHAKKMINRSKFKNYYNCSSIIVKTLHNILKALTHSSVLEEKFKKLNFNNDKIIKLVESNMFGDKETVHIYNKKINNFNDGKHLFILVWDYSLSFYSRDAIAADKYFPEGLNVFLDNTLPGSGGHFTAAGSPRKVKIYEKEFKMVVQKIYDRIIEIDGVGVDK